MAERPSEAGTGIGSGVWQAELSDRERSRLEALLEQMAEDPLLRRVAVSSLGMLGLRPGDRVLDVGCGSGVLLPALGELVTPGGEVIGLDYAQPLLDAARERLEGTSTAAVVTLVQGDAHQLPFEDAAFDAAHVERVLIHLEDADKALREIRRVVRPGGWVVAAEPDAAGIRIDHPADPEAMALIAERDTAAIRNPGMGLELNRRLAKAGLVDRRIEVFTELDRSYHPISAAGDRDAADALVADGELGRDRADAAIAYLEGASERGEYAWIGSMVVVAGRVPDEPAEEAARTA